VTHATATELPAKVQRRAIWLLVAASTLCYLSIGSYVAVLPGYVLDHIGSTTTALGIAMGATAAVAVALRPFSGALGDQYGRRPLALVGAAVIGGAAAVLLGPGVLALVLVARVLLGAGDALFTTAAMAWVADVAHPARRGRAMATLGMSFWLGFALGPQWSTFARDHGGYEAVWIAAALTGLLAAVLVRFVPIAAPPAHRETSARPARLPRAALLPALAMLLTCYGNGVFEAFGIVHLTDQGVADGAGIGGAASVFTIVAVTTFIGRFAGGVLSDRLGPRPVAMAGILFCGGSYTVLAAASSFGAAACGAALLGIGLALLYPALALSVTRRVPPAERGAGLGVFLAAMDVAFGLGPVIGGLVVTASSSSFALWSATAVAMLALPLVFATHVPAVEEEHGEGLELAEESPGAPV